GQWADGRRVPHDQPGASAGQAAGSAAGIEPGPVPRRGAPGAKLGAGLRVEARVRPEALGTVLRYPERRSSGQTRYPAVPRPDAHPAVRGGPRSDNRSITWVLTH